MILSKMFLFKTTIQILEFPKFRKDLVQGSSALYYIIKLISKLLLFFSLFLPNILAASLQAPIYRHSVISSVINNDSMLKILLAHVEKDLQDPELRLVSKTFMKVFDELRSEKLLLLDPRVKYLIKDEDGQVILSPIGTFLPKSVPLLMLYNSYLDLFYPLDKKGFDEKFLVLEIPENATADALIKITKEQNTIDSQRFMEMLRNVVQIAHSRFPYYHNPVEKLHRFYRLLVATFSEETFINEIVKSIDFPMKRFLFYATSGQLKNPKGTEILSRFSINCNPVLILNAIETGIPDLVRAILNNPQNDLSILKDQQTKGSLGPTHLAATKKNVEVINLLLERGFPADVKGRGGIRPIHLAARYGNYEAVVKLFEFDNDVASSPLSVFDEPAPIVEAAQRGHIRIVRFFLTQDSVDLTKNREISRRLVDIAVFREDAKFGKLLIKSPKVKLTSAEIRSLRSLK